MKKIIFFTGSQALSGGTERACANVANLLISYGFETTILSQYEGKRSAHEVDPNVKLHELNVKRKKGIRGYFGTIFKLLCYVRKHRPDIVIAVESLSFLYFLPLVVFPKRPVLINWEHFNARVLLGKRSRGWSRKLAVFLADHVVVLSDADKAIWISELKCSQSKITRIYNVNPLETARRPFYSSAQKSNPSAIAVGRLTYQKGFDLLIRSWSMIPETVRDGWQLNIYGEGPDRDFLQRKIISLNLDHQISLSGQTADILAEYTKSDFFILSSRFEGFGLVLLEALSCGLPVISFDCFAGPSEIISEGNNGILVPPSDIVLLSRAISALMQNDAMRTKMARIDKNTLDRFSSGVIGLEWLSLIGRY